jgi:predicted GNAT family N-acyltransferase
MTALDRPPAMAGDAEVTTRVVRSDAEMEAVYRIRRDVFVREQGLTGTVYDDPDDRHSVHILAQKSGVIIGVGRLTMVGDEGQIAWLAVLPQYRRSGAGRAMMEHLLRIAREKRSNRVSLNAQTHALAFYTAFGFVPVGRRFSMSNIEHQFMTLEYE